VLAVLTAAWLRDTTRSKPFRSLTAAIERLLAEPSAPAGCVEPIDVAWLDRALGPLAGMRFEPQRPAPRRRGPTQRRDLYDVRIAEGGVVPSRAGSAHDLFNALAWATFPTAKAALHARQSRSIPLTIDGALRAKAPRSREHDTLAMLDEGGVLVACCDELTLGALTEALHAGSEALVRGLVRDGANAMPLLFGHAVAEHLALGKAGVPRVSVVGFVCPIRGDGVVPAADAALARLVGDAKRFLAPPSWRAPPLDALFDLS